MLCTNKLHNYTLNIIDLKSSEVSSIKKAANIYDSIAELETLDFLLELNTIFNIEAFDGNSQISIEDFIDDIDNICPIPEYMALITRVKRQIYEYLSVSIETISPMLNDDEILSYLGNTRVLANIYTILPDEKKKEFTPDDPVLLLELSTYLQMNIPTSYENFINLLLDNKITYQEYKSRVATMVLPLVVRNMSLLLENITPSVAGLGTGTGLTQSMTKEQFEEAMSSNSFATDNSKEQNIIEQQNVNKMLKKVDQGAFEKHGIDKNIFKKKKKS